MGNGHKISFNIKKDSQYLDLKFEDDEKYYKYYK